MNYYLRKDYRFTLGKMLQKRHKHCIDSNWVENDSRANKDCANRGFAANVGALKAILSNFLLIRRVLRRTAFLVLTKWSLSGNTQKADESKAWKPTQRKVQISCSNFASFSWRLERQTLVSSATVKDENSINSEFGQRENVLVLSSTHHVGFDIPNLCEGYGTQVTTIAAVYASGCKAMPFLIVTGKIAMSNWIAPLPSGVHEGYCIAQKD